MLAELQKAISNINKKIKCLSCKIDSLSSGENTNQPLVAIPWSADHANVYGNPYSIGDVVYYQGNVYRCIANNDSIIPTSTLYWTNLGAGYPLVERPIDWNATTGNNQILNKPQPSYKVYTALLQQNGTNDPVATVYENTTGQDIVFTRTNTGQYSCTLVGSPFGSDSSKFFITANIRNIPPITSTTSVYTGCGFQFIGFANLINYFTFDSTGAYSDGSNITIEIRVYN